MPGTTLDGRPYNLPAQQLPLPPLYVPRKSILESANYHNRYILPDIGLPIELEMIGKRYLEQRAHKSVKLTKLTAD